MRTFLILATLLLCSCSADKRLSRFLRNHPEFATRDTITVRDTVYLEGARFDSAIVVYVHDTIRIDTGRIHVRLVRVPTGSPCDTAAINAQLMGWVEPDTVFFEKQVFVDKLVPCPEGWKGRVASWWRVVAIVMSCLFVLTLVIVILRK